MWACNKCRIVLGLSIVVYIESIIEPISQILVVYRIDFSNHTKLHFDSGNMCINIIYIYIYIYIPGVTKHFARGLQYGSGQLDNNSSCQIYSEFNSWSNKTKSKAIATDAMILQKFPWKNSEVKSLKNPWIFFVFLSKCTFP